LTVWTEKSIWWPTLRFYASVSETRNYEPTKVCTRQISITEILAQWYDMHLKNMKTIVSKFVEFSCRMPLWFCDFLLFARNICITIRLFIHNKHLKRFLWIQFLFIEMCRWHNVIPVQLCRTKLFLQKFSLRGLLK
jgi:hypothetical protein